MRYKKAGIAVLLRQFLVYKNVVEVLIFNLKKAD